MKTFNDLGVSNMKFSFTDFFYKMVYPLAAFLLWFIMDFKAKVYAMPTVHLKSRKYRFLSMSLETMSLTDDGYLSSQFGEWPGAQACPFTENRDACPLRGTLWLHKCSGPQEDASLIGRRDRHREIKCLCEVYKTGLSLDCFLFACFLLQATFRRINLF